jgi:hypothetical protein
MEINENGESIPISDNRREDGNDDNMPKRKMNIADLAQVKIRKYRYHDKYEKK